MTDSRFTGVLAPVVTPFDAQLNPDPRRLADHCRWLLSQGVALAVFGTNSEANSLSVDEKIDLLDALVDQGIDPRQLMPGTGCCALSDSVRLTRHAVNLGCRGVLMLPPFYYKNVSDAGLFASYAEIIQRVGSASLHIYLYHIPPVAQVPISISLIEQLLKQFPENVVGIKDSSGSWENTRAMLEADWDDFRIFVGSEAFLLANLRAGGAGCISATANVNPGPISKLAAHWQDSDADARQQDLNRVRDFFQSFPMIPTLKSTVGIYRRDAEWNRVRPPLVPLDGTTRQSLQAGLGELGFKMPGLGAQ